MTKKIENESMVDFVFRDKKIKRKELKPIHNLKAVLKEIRNHLAENTLGQLGMKFWLNNLSI